MAPSSTLGSVGQCTLFVAFVLLGVGRTTVIFSANSFAYNPTSVVTASEFTKLILAIIMFLRVDGSFSDLFPAIWENKKLFIHYAIPAVLYAAVNNLNILNLLYFDPATFTVLAQFGTFVTAVTFQVVFARTLSARKWAALAVIVAGCVVKEYPKFRDSDALDPGTGADSIELPYVMKLGLLLIQLVCSSFAGVYNELLLKKQTAPVNLQNIFMYVNSIVVNMIYLVFFTNAATVKNAFSRDNLEIVLGSRVVFVVLSGAFIGICTSLFLKHLGSVMKTIANACTVGATAVVSFVIFGTDLGIFTMVSIAFVGAGLYVYSTDGSSKQAASVKPTAAVPTADMLLETGSLGKTRANNADVAAILLARPELLK